MLKTENIHYKVADKEILRGVSLAVHKGDFVGIIGPNGCGKTTLLKNIYRELKPDAGAVYIGEREITGIKNKDLARIMSVVIQEHHVEFDFTVKEVIAMGRFNKMGRFGQTDEADEKAIQECLTKVGLEELAHRNYLSLSGGEKQRTMIALALCQNTELIILDEPTNHLDIKHQLHIVHMLKHLGITVLTTIHDMNIAGTYCDYIYAMKNGKIVKEGAVDTVFTEDFFSEVFEVEAYVYRNPKSGKMNISYLYSDIE